MGIHLTQNGGTYSRRFFYELAECGLIGKIQFIGYFLDTHLGCQNHGAGSREEQIVYNGTQCLAKDAGGNLVQVLCGQAHLLGIEFGLMLLAVVVHYQAV